MICGVTLSDCNSVSQPVETLRSSTHKWQPKVKWDMILATRNLPHKVQNPQKLGIEEQWHHYVKYIFHQRGARLGGCEWMLLSIRNLEPVRDTVLLPSQGQEAFSWAWPGPPDLEVCSCASDSDWRFRFITSKRQRESPKLVAITDEGNRRFEHNFLGFRYVT